MIRVIIEIDDDRPKPTDSLRDRIRRGQGPNRFGWPIDPYRHEYERPLEPIKIL